MSSFIDLPVVKISEVNEALKRNSSAKINIDDFEVRDLANQTGFRSPVRWSDFVGVRLLTASSVSFGLNLFFNWNGSGAGNNQNINQYFPGIITGDKFSVIVGQTNGWAGSNANGDYGSYFVYPLWEVLFTYGSARTETKLAGYSIGSGSGNFKGSFFDVIYNGANRISTRGFYSGGSSNVTNGTNYLMGFKFIPTITSDTPLTNFTVTSYASNNPANTAIIPV
jgi:hypothetical protein